MKKQVENVLLPTEDYTGIVLHGTGIDNILHTKEGAENAVLNIGGQHQHAYVTVSQATEPIKEGDWYLSPKNTLSKCIRIGDNYIASLECGSYKPENCRKIIATTDPKLKTTISPYLFENGGACKSKDFPIPQVHTQFLEEFINNPDRVWEVEYVCLTSTSFGIFDTSKNPSWNQTAPSKCIEWKLKVDKDNTVNIISAIGPHGEDCGCRYTKEGSVGLGCPNPRSILVVESSGPSTISPTEKLHIKDAPSTVWNIQHNLNMSEVTSVEEKVYTLEQMYLSASNAIDKIIANRGNSEWNMRTTPKMIVDDWIKENL